MKFILLSLVFWLNSNADITAIPKESLLQDAASKSVVNEVLKFLPKAGNHFNLKAPQMCGKFQAYEKSAQEVKCQFPVPGEHKITLNICDDAETFCKTERFPIKVTAPRGFVRTNSPSRQTMVYVPKGERPAPPGFLQNNPAIALAQAKKQKKLMLIAFSAHWCPACNMLSELVYPDKTFKDSTKNLVKILLDVDSDISWGWKDKFRVGGYPTIVIANSNLEEIGRLVGYRTTAALLKWLESQKLLANETLEIAEAKIHDYDKNPNYDEKEQNNDRRLRVGQWYFDRGEFEKAVTYFDTLTIAKAIRLKKLAVLNLLKFENDKAKLLDMYEKLIGEYPADIEYTSWVEGLSNLDKEKAKKYLDLVEKNIVDWSSSEAIAEEDYSVADLREVQAQIFKNLGDEEKSKEKYMLCATFYEEMAKKSNLKLARGPNLERAYCLLNSGQVVQAKDLYQKMATAYHGEFAFTYNFASALMELNDLKPAYKNIKLAYQNSYGDNFLRAATLKAKIEMKMNKKNDAVKTINDSLTKVYLPPSTQLRTHRYYTQLKNLLNDVEKK